jgi:hypothetical protein
MIHCYRSSNYDLKKWNRGKVIASKSTDLSSLQSNGERVSPYWDLLVPMWKHLLLLYSNIFNYNSLLCA